MNKRKWFYLSPPKVYEVAPCSCGNQDTQWSEYEAHIWCENCQKDFIPQHNGIFSGPLLLKTAQMMGLSFDRFNLETNQVEVVSDQFYSTSEVSYTVCHQWTDIVKNKQIPILITQKEENSWLTHEGVLFFDEKQLTVKFNKEFPLEEKDEFGFIIKIDYPNTQTYVLHINVKKPPRK